MDTFYKPEPYGTKKGKITIQQINRTANILRNGLYLLVLLVFGLPLFIAIAITVSQDVTYHAGSVGLYNGSIPFQVTPSTIQNLQYLRYQYSRAKDLGLTSEQKSLGSEILRKAMTFKEGTLPSDLQGFINQLKEDQNV